jgi:hypothetical protein
MKLAYAVVVLTAFAAAGAAQAERREIDQGVASACKSELEQLCKGERRAKEAEQCLRNNESKLSSDCKGAISKAPQPK